MSISILGTYHTEFGQLDKTIYDLLTETGQGALEAAPITAKEVGGIWVGNFSGGNFNNQEHLGPYTMNIDSDLRFTPATRVENACASGSAAIKEAKNALEAGKVDYALVIGAEKMTTLDTEGVTKTLAKASHWPEEGAQGMTFPGLFAEFAAKYKDRYNLSEKEFRKMLAQVAAKNHTNATANPLAQMPWNCNYQDILDKPDDKNPVVAPPLKLFDCSLVTDGAAGLILTTTEKAKKLQEKVVEIAGLGHTTDYLRLSQRSNSEFVAGKQAIQQAYQQANITVNDLDFAEVHDCFTIAEILAYEALGLAENGKGKKLLEEGRVQADGEIPVNASGGLKAKGHPVGATGASMAVLATRQLLNNAIGHQVSNPETGITFNIGGSSASNYALVFKRLK